MVWGGKRYVTNVCMYAGGTIPHVFWYNYPNCALQAPQGERSLKGSWQKY